MVYGTKALLPVESGVPNLCTQCYEETENLKSTLLDLELIKETREEVSLKMAAYQNGVKETRERTFQVEDLVLRYTQVAQIQDRRKLSET